MNDKISKINHWKVLVTGLLSFALSLMWYSPVLFGKIWKELRSSSINSTPGWTMIFAPFRELIVAYTLAYLIKDLAVANWKKAVQLGFWLWLAFQGVGMAGAILWDNMPLKLGAVHAGDWLMKMLFMSVTLSIWHRKNHPLVQRVKNNDLGIQAGEQ